VTFKQALWRAFRTKLIVFMAFAVLAICYFDIGGAERLPNDRSQQPDVTCLSLPSFYVNGACDHDPNT
jgi:hypothetical protein